MTPFLSEIASIRGVVLRSLVVVSCAVGAIGCGGGTKGPTIYPAKGTVTVDGKPAYGALIVLHPVDKSLEIRPGAEADEDGGFVLTSFKPQDGAPAGEFKVAVRWLQEQSTREPGQATGAITGMGGGEESKTDPIDRLQGRYANPETSGLKCTIGEDGDNEIPTLDLKSNYGTPVGPGGPVVEGA